MQVTRPGVVWFVSLVAERDMAMVKRAKRWKKVKRAKKVKR